MTSFEDSWKVEIRRGLLQYAVLAIVKQHEKGIHGYGIARELEEKTDGLLEVKVNQGFVKRNHTDIPMGADYVR